MQKYLKELKDKMEPSMTEQKFLLHLMMNLPSEYDDVQPIIEMQLASRNEPLTLASFKQIVCDKFDRLKVKSKKLLICAILLPA